MTPLPALRGDLVVWRLERAIHVSTWEQAEGAFRVGGRWSPAGRRVIYTSLDPATTILEVAVHKGFDVLDAVPHSLLQSTLDSAGAHVVDPADVPNPNWLRPGTVSASQQEFGAALLDRYPLVLICSQHCAARCNATTSRDGMGFRPHRTDEEAQVRTPGTDSLWSSSPLSIRS